MEATNQKSTGVDACAQFTIELEHIVTSGQNLLGTAKARNLQGLSRKIGNKNLTNHDRAGSSEHAGAQIHWRHHHAAHLELIRL